MRGDRWLGIGRSDVWVCIKKKVLGTVANAITSRETRDREGKK